MASSGVRIYRICKLYKKNGTQPRCRDIDVEDCHSFRLNVYRYEDGMSEFERNGFLYDADIWKAESNRRDVMLI